MPSFFVITDACKVAVTTILNHEADQLLHEREIRAVDDRPPFAAGDDQVGIAHVTEMKRQRVMRNFQFFTDPARRYACGAVFHQQTKDPKAGFLRKRIKGDQSFLYIHLSNIMDMSLNVNNNGHVIP